MPVFAENWVFFKQWSKHPFRLGTCFPISNAFARDVVGIIKTIAQPDAPIIELGAGTGRLTNALVEGGFSNVSAVELEQEFCTYLSDRFKNHSSIRQIVHGDARFLPDLMPDLKGKTSLVISVIPLMYLPHELRQEIVDAAFEMLAPGGQCIHVCYTPVSPLKKEAYKAKKIYSRFRHSPPAFVWSFEPHAS